MKLVLRMYFGFVINAGFLFQPECGSEDIKSSLLQSLPLPNIRHTRSTNEGSIDASSIRNKKLIVVFLDESHSVETHKADIIKGYNAFLDTLAAIPKGDVNTRLLMIKFNQFAKVGHKVLPLDIVPRLTEESFRPYGVTALFDAVIIGAGMVEAIVTDNERISVIIITDGKDNASKKVDKSGIENFVKRKMVVDKWSFHCLGTTKEELENLKGLQSNVNKHLCEFQSSHSIIENITIAPLNQNGRDPRQHTEFVTANSTHTNGQPRFKYHGVIEQNRTTVEAGAERRKSPNQQKHLSNFDKNRNERDHRNNSKPETQSSTPTSTNYSKLLGRAAKSTRPPKILINSSYSITPKSHLLIFSNKMAVHATTMRNAPKIADHHSSTNNNTIHPSKDTLTTLSPIQAKTLKFQKSTTKYSAPTPGPKLRSNMGPMVSRHNKKHRFPLLYQQLLERIKAKEHNQQKENCNVGDCST